VLKISQRRWVRQKTEASQDSTALSAWTPICACAAAACVAAIDTVYTDIDNLAGLELEARIARRDGFSAKALIHPKHVDTVNTAFAATAAERAWAEKVVAAFAANPHHGTLRLDDKMIDKPHLTAAKKILGL
jgi:citrate lyase subunit beta/citryl-CoA lyase